MEVFDDAFDKNSSSDSEESDVSFDDVKRSFESTDVKESLSCKLQNDPPGLRGLPKCYGDHADPLPVWRCLFTDEMIGKIIARTNRRFYKIRDNYAQKRKTDLTDVDEIELKAFLGLLYYTSILKSQHEDLDSLFATDGTGRDIFRCTMSLKRLLNILLCLTYDDVEDESAPSDENSITWLFDQLVLNSQQCYCTGEYVCIDKMLVNYGGRSKNINQLSRKSGKRGMKIFALCDVQTGYFLNGYVYTGRNCHGYGLTPEEKQTSERTQAVLRLTRPIVSSNRNITASKWFGSVEVINELIKRNLTYVGPLRKTLKEIPTELLQWKGRNSGSSLYSFMENVTLLSYITEQKKTIVLASSMYRTEEIDQGTRKPKIITFYNNTRGAVDIIGKNCATYSTYNRRAARLATAVFYTGLNIAVMNSFILYGCYVNNPNTSKYNFIKGLAKELVEPHLKRRVLNKSLPREIRTSITRIIGEPIMHTPTPKDEKGKTLKRRRCQLCPSAHDKKTSTQCLICSRAMCGDCRYMVCKECGTEFQ